MSSVADAVAGAATRRSWSQAQRLDGSSEFHNAPSFDVAHNMGTLQDSLPLRRMLSWEMVANHKIAQPVASNRYSVKSARALLYAGIFETLAELALLEPSVNYLRTCPTKL